MPGTALVTILITSARDHRRCNIAIELPDFRVPYESIGRRIKRYRTDRGISQEVLGKTVFVNNQHISRIESGKVVLSLELLTLIANALDVSADDLLTDNLKHSSSPVGTEIHDLLLDCNNDEKAILTRTLTFLKALLSEFGV